MTKRLMLLVMMSSLGWPCSQVVSTLRQIWKKRPGAESKLFAFERNGKIGFINNRGEVVIPARSDGQVELTGDFEDGFARVGGRYIDAAGNLIHGYPPQPPRSPGILYVYNGRAKPEIRHDPIRIDIDRVFPPPKGFAAEKFKPVIPAVFADAHPFSEGLARVVVDGDCYIQHPDTRRTNSPANGSRFEADTCGGEIVRATKACKVGFIDASGTFAIRPQFDTAQDFHEGLAAVLVGSGVTAKWGFVDKSGTLVIAGRFQSAGPFREGLAVVDCSGAINKKGRVVIPPFRYRWIQSFSESLAVAMGLDNKFYFINRGGAIQLGPYEDASSFVHGLASVRTALDPDRIFYIDRKGEVVFDYLRAKWPLRAVDDEQLRACAGRRAVRFRVVCDLVAHAGLEREAATVGEFGYEFAFEAE